jgi:hypothetical protein
LNESVLFTAFSAIRLAPFFCRAKFVTIVSVIPPIQIRKDALADLCTSPVVINALEEPGQVGRQTKTRSGRDFRPVISSQENCGDISGNRARRTGRGWTKIESSRHVSAGDSASRPERRSIF